MKQAGITIVTARHYGAVKTLFVLLAITTATLGIGIAIMQFGGPRYLLHFGNIKKTAGHWTTDPQYAAGEWKVEVQTQPCDSPLKVTYPQESGAPMTIECNNMPVQTR